MNAQTDFTSGITRTATGEPREEVTEWLCDLSVTDPYKRELLAEARFSAVNLARHEALRSQTPAPVQPLTVGDFWEQTYRPWVEANKRFSTLRGYTYDWDLYVKEQIAHHAITTFRTPDAVALLDHCASPKPNGKGLNKRSLAHVKSLCSGIFSLAAIKGIIEFNPWREAKPTVKVRKAATRIEYTPEETINILDAIKRTDAKLFFAPCAVMGLRPSEAAATKWENIGDGALRIREAAPYGVLGELKTENSKGDIFITEPVTSLLAKFRKERIHPVDGLLFTFDGVTPINHNSFARSNIKPHALKVCARWNGCYSGRHGAATSLYNETGDVRAAYQVFRNSLAVVSKEYIKPSVEQGQNGQLQCAKALLKASKKRRSSRKLKLLEKQKK